MILALFEFFCFSSAPPHLGLLVEEKKQKIAITEKIIAFGPENNEPRFFELVPCGVPFTLPVRQLGALENFHKAIFAFLLKGTKTTSIFHRTEETTSLHAIIVPLIPEDSATLPGPAGSSRIDWNLIAEFERFQEGLAEPLSEGQWENAFAKGPRILTAIDSPGLYFLSSGFSPSAFGSSPFPNPQYSSFRSYYHQRHQLEIQDSQRFLSGESYPIPIKENKFLPDSWKIRPQSILWHFIQNSSSSSTTTPRPSEEPPAPIENLSNTAYFLPSKMILLPGSLEFHLFIRFLPFLFTRIERNLSALAFRSLSENPPIALFGSPRHFVDAFTSGNARDYRETGPIRWVGEAVLKFLVSLEIFLSSPDSPEELTRARQIRQFRLLEILSNRFQKENYDRFCILEPLRLSEFLPYGFERSWLVKENYSKPKLSKGQRGEFCLALLGAYFATGGVRAAQQFVNNWISPDPPLSIAFQPAALSRASTKIPEELEFLRSSAPPIEILLGYQFSDRRFLFQAFLHGSSPLASRVSGCSYERLEWFGDSLLDLLTSEFLRPQQLAVGSLNFTRNSLVANHQLGRRILKLGLDKFLQLDSPFLLQQIDLARAMADSGGVTPKILGDLFESLLAAVFLDSGGSLVETWKILTKLMDFEPLENSTRVS